MPNIAFDGFWWVDGPPSGRNVVKSLITTWAKTYPEDIVEVLVPKADHRQAMSDLAEYENVVVLATAWRQHAIFNLFSKSFGSSADLVIHQNFSRLWRRSSGTRQRLVFFHDALAQEHPEWFTFAERLYMRIASLSLKCADIVVTSSLSEAKRIAKYNPNLGLPIVAVGLGLPTTFTSVVAQAPAVKVKAKNYLLAVGRLNVRKNVERLICALRENSIISEEFPLVVAGSSDGVNYGLKTVEGENDVQFTGYVSDAELKWLYENAKTFIFPSLDEGFGLPVLEASFSSTSMAISDIPSFREFGPVAHLFDPRSSKSISRAVLNAISEPIVSPKLTEIYSWELTVDKIRKNAGI